MPRRAGRRRQAAPGARSEGQGRGMDPTVASSFTSNQIIGQLLELNQWRPHNYSRDKLAEVLDKVIVTGIGALDLNGWAFYPVGIQ